MTEVEVPKPLKHFADRPDPRKPREVRHELGDIVVISILAVICGANTYSKIRQYALAQQDWLKTVLKLPFEIPNQDTFERIFALLEPSAWQACFLAWLGTLLLPELKDGEDEVLAMDGKTAKGSAQRGMAALHTVSTLAFIKGYRKRVRHEISLHTRNRRTHTILH